MENMKKWNKIPEFGKWDYSDEMPITQYFESARQAGLVRGRYYAAPCEEDLFRVPVNIHFHRKARKGCNSSGGEEKPCSNEQKQRKQATVMATPKADDEDLYKIPPELLYQKPKRKRLLSNMLSGCLGLNCIA